MEAIFYSHARNNLKTIINDVCDNYNEYIVTTNDNQSAVIISHAKYVNILQNHVNMLQYKHVNIFFKTMYI